MTVKDKFVNLFVVSLISFLMILLLVCACEYLLRKRHVSKPVSGRWYDIAKSWDKRDVHNAVISDPQRKQKYYDYFMYSAGEYASETINYTGDYAYRVSPDSVNEADADHIIWFFGGSTMQNHETSDLLTIANQAALNLNQKSFNVFVRNYGTGSFQTSMELIKFQTILKNTPSDKRPTAVVFYDGYNDAVHGIMFGAGNMQSDLSIKMRMLVENSWDKMLRYSLAQYLQEKSFFFKRFLYRHIVPKEIYEGFVWDCSRENVMKSAEIYISNLMMIRGICKQFDIKPFFVLQPMLVTKKGSTVFENKYSVNDDMRKAILLFYAEVKKKLSSSPDFLDLSFIFDNNGRDDFYDLGHTSPFSGRKTGKEIAGFLYEKFKS